MRKLGILVAVMLLAMVYGVSAALTFVTPASGGTLTDSVTQINVSSTISVEETKWVNLTLYCSDTANSTEIRIATNMTVNVSGPMGTGRQYWNYSQVNINRFVDSANCVLTARDNNSQSGTVTFSIDGTVPACNWTQSSRKAYKPTQKWTVTGTNATSATMQFGSNSYLTMTESAASNFLSTFTYTGAITESTYPLVVARVTDGTNTTTCSLEYVKIDADAEVTKTAIIVTDSGQKTTTTQPGLDPKIIWIGLAAVAIWYYQKKKK